MLFTSPGRKAKTVGKDSGRCSPQAERRPDRKQSFLELRGMSFARWGKGGVPKLLSGL